jgi:hypothetical protein
MIFRYIFLISVLFCNSFLGNAQQFSFSSGSDFRSNTHQVHVSVGQLFGSFQLSNSSFQEGALSILLNATSLDEVASLEKLIHIYPNPTTNFVKIESDIFPWLTSSASIYTIQGILVDSYPIHDPQSQISLSHLPDGAYVLRLSIPGQEDYFHKILKIN